MDPSNLQNQPNQQQDRPIPFDGVATGQTTVSRQPLNIGTATGQAQPPSRPATPQPTAAVQKVSIGDRIIGMKTFFAKLHPGSLTFLEDQIQAWLKEHPGVRIKTTNVTVGEVQGKTTEPNLIVVIWY